MQKSFWKSGHTPTLLTAFLYFDLSFMTWYLLSPLQKILQAELGLSVDQRALVVATPILAGALLRVVFGILVDRIGPKMAGVIGQLVVMSALGIAWLNGIHSMAQALLLGVSLGVAGAAFAVALPLASRWYPPEHQGTAMGIAGAGNSGTVLAVLLAPVLATAYGWQNVFGLALIPVGVAFILFVLFAKDAPNAAAPKRFADYTKALADKDAWWFMFFYTITFGGFSGFAGALPGYFADQFGFDLKTAGIYTAACVFSGSVMRPLGGVLADRIGGVKSLLVVYTAASVLIAMAGFNLGGAVGTTATFIIAMLFLGMGNGSVFQLVPQRFRQEIGVMTGLIGMAGGVGGFLLAAGLGKVKAMTGSYSLGLWLFAALGLVAWIGLTNVKSRWRTTWGSAAMTSARI